MLYKLFRVFFFIFRLKKWETISAQQLSYIKIFERPSVECFGGKKKNKKRRRKRLLSCQKYCFTFNAVYFILTIA